MPRGAAVIKYEGKRGVVFRIKYTDGAGRQVQETLGPAAEGWSRTKAKAELRERLVKVERKNWRRPRPTTLAEYGPRWLEGREAERGLKPSSVRAYRRAINLLTASLGALPLGSISPRHLADYKREQLERLSSTTVAYDLAVLRDLLQTALKEELVDRNVMDLVERPKPVNTNWRILRPEEVGRIAREFTDERARLVFLMLVLTGMRRHELQGLRWSDVSLIDNTLKVRRSKSKAGERTIALPSSLAEALWQYRRVSPFQGDDELVFAHPRTGGKLNADWFGDEFEAARKRAGVDGYMRPMHDLRHTCLTNYAVSGDPIKLMTMAGHTNMATTKKYLHLAGEAFPTEAEALEKRYGGGTLYPTVYPSERTSEHLTAPETA
jgi:integrase